MPRPALLLPLLWLAGSPPGVAQRPALPGTPEEEPGGLPALELLMEGSILQQVLIPRYDVQRRLESSLQAEHLEMIDRKTIDAREVTIRFFHPDARPKARIELETARLSNERFLRSRDPVAIVADNLDATGRGLVYDLRESRGLLTGPATARFATEPLTAMHPALPQPRGLGALSLIAASALHAQQTPPLDESQRTGLDRLSVSRAGEVAQAAGESAERLASADRQSAQADQTLDDFLREAAVNLPAGPTPDLSTKVADPEVPQVEGLASIRAAEAIYFDSEGGTGEQGSGLLTFLRDVEVDHPQFTLVGADEMKVFFERSADAPASDDASEEDGAGDFGEPRRIIATGTLVIESTGDGSDGVRSFKASGRQLVYDLQTQEMILRGGQPWVISDDVNGRILEPDGYIRYNVRTRKALIHGRAEAIVPTGGND